MICSIWLVGAIIISGLLTQGAQALKLDMDWAVPTAYAIGFLWPVVIVIAIIGGINQAVRPHRDVDIQS